MASWPSSRRRMSRTPTSSNSATRRSAAVVVWVTAVCAGVSCGSPAASSGQPVVRQVIGPSGGTASTANGRLKVQVPVGALKANVAITIQQLASSSSGAIGPVYEVGPTGTVFQSPVTLSFKYTAADLGGLGASDLHVATLSGGSWVPVTSEVNLQASVVTGHIMHLSPWTLILSNDIVLPEPDAGAAGTEGTGGADSAAGAEAGTSGGGGTSGAAGKDGGAVEATGA